MFIRFFLACSIPLLSSSVVAQEYAEFVDREQFFSVVLPGEPTIEDIDYVFLNEEIMPAKQYAAERRGGRYLVTVVDLTSNDNVSTVRGAIAYEAWNIRKHVAERDGEITYDAYAQVSRVEAHQILATYPDESRSSWQLLMQNRRLYIQQAILPPDQPAAGLFLSSLWILDENGEVLRNTIDFNGQIIEIGRGYPEG